MDAPNLYNENWSELDLPLSELQKMARRKRLGHSMMVGPDGQVFTTLEIADELPPPRFTGWEQYLAETPVSEIRRWCYGKASKANRKRLLSPEPSHLIGVWDVYRILFNAHGRCLYCGSLCVEKRPTVSGGLAPLPWAPVGRRIGSLGHRIARIDGGDNDLSNLNWECLWCNTWPSQRIPGATDHGAIR